jgi:hypothetical protein
MTKHNGRIGSQGRMTPGLFALMLAVAGWGLAPAIARDKNDVKTRKTPPDAPKGWIVLEEDFWTPLTHEPGTYFHRAHEEFLKKDYDLAAIDLRQAAAYLRLQARRSTYTEHSSALYAAANRLSNLAASVEKKDVKSPGQLDREFARAHCALAEHDYTMAKESWNKKRPYTTGYNLNAAAFNLESGYSWAYQETGTAGFDAMADANALADELIAGEPKNYEVSATLDAVHNAIQSLSMVVDQLPKDPGLAMNAPVIAVAPAFEPGWVLVEEDVWTDLPDSTGRHLHNAYEAFLHKRSEQAANELHQAIFGLELQAGRATGDDKTALMDSIHGLEALLVSYDHTQADLTLPYRQYDRAMANACYALARHHCEMAEADWAADLKSMAGYDLKWAEDYLERGRVWADHLNDRVAGEHLRDARKLSEALIAGKAEQETNVASRIESLEQEVMTLRAAVVAMAQ